MTDAERQLAAKMLEAYSDMLSCGGCDDYPLEDTPENRVVEAAVIEWSDDPELTPCEPGHLCLTNWMVASMLASLLKAEQ